MVWAFAFVDHDVLDDYTMCKVISTPNKTPAKLRNAVTQQPNHARYDMMTRIKIIHP